MLRGDVLGQLPLYGERVKFFADVKLIALLLKMTIKEKKKKIACKRRNPCTPAEEDETPTKEEDEKSIAMVDINSLNEIDVNF
ncbi:hypothetical protein EVAR_75400_1 [Eumeta japonica]|uniref:Uncharacterized protein n=1 Tax=Eumeta variegata TaxID=151549 RepID=A0A4C1TMU7_EUMVA|nr:hypothetical protein EVAR_75400_1 [Eumeta japonica]